MYVSLKLTSSPFHAAIYSLLLAVLSTALIVSRANAQVKSTNLQDPMFGLSYDYNKVHYEKITSDVSSVCSGYIHGSYWIFAHVRRATVDYYIVMGVDRHQDGDALGAALAIEGGKCFEEDSSRALSGAVPKMGFRPAPTQKRMLPGLDAPDVCDHGVFGGCHYILRSSEEEAILRALVNDGIERGARAWGYKFRNALCEPSREKVDEGMPVVRQEVQKYCAVQKSK